MNKLTASICVIVVLIIVTMMGHPHFSHHKTLSVIRGIIFISDGELLNIILDGNDTYRDMKKVMFSFRGKNEHEKKMHLGAMKKYMGVLKQAIEIKEQEMLSDANNVSLRL